MARRGWGSIQERGGKFYGRFRLDGRPTMRLLVRPDGLPCSKLQEAERSLGRLRDDLEDEKLAPRRAPLSFRAWCKDEYLPVLAVRLAPGSLRSAGTHFERFASWSEQNELHLMEDVRKKHAEAFVQWLISTEGCKPSYVARLVRTLRGAWRDAEGRGLVRNGAVWDDVQIRVGPADEVPWISPKQLTDLYAATNPAQRPLVTLLGESGLRVGEAFALRWRDVEFGDQPTLFVTTGKTRASRRKVPLTARAVTTLQGLPRGDDDALVFEVRTAQGVREAVRSACKRSGLPMLRTHSLRHVAASHLVQAGVPPTTVARVLGHADGGVLVIQRYGRWAPADAEAAAMDRMAAWRASPAAPGRPATGGTSPASRTNRGRSSGQGDRSDPATTGGGS